MPEDLPQEQQVIEIRFNGDDWQLAVFQHGEFVDVFGLPLDRTRISDWRAANRQLPDPPKRHRGWVLP
jgi:hypothetical protein